MEEPTDTDGQQQVGSLDLLWLIEAYNRREISLDEWLKLTKEWAEDIIRRNELTTLKPD